MIKDYTVELHEGADSKGTKTLCQRDWDSTVTSCSSYKENTAYAFHWDTVTSSKMFNNYSFVLKG